MVEIVGINGVGKGSLANKNNSLNHKKNSKW